MQDLRLVGIHEDGEHVLLSDEDGQRYRVPLDESLRAAIRRERPRGDGSPEGTERPPMRPRDVQALMRSGSSVDEVAERSGWDIDKVRRYEPPIRAERDYVAGLARAVQLRGRGHGEGVPTLGSRVLSRLTERGVDVERVAWDAWKTESGIWSVVCIFPAGGRERRASWRFVPVDRTLTAADDEARWLGEDEQAGGPLPAPAVAPAGRTSAVYDVEAEGGVTAAVRRRQAKPATSDDTSGAQAPAQQAAGDGSEEGADDATGTVDLMSAMRERAATRKRGRGGARKPVSPADTPIAPEDMPEQAKPVEHLRIADAPPPPLGSHPDPAELAEPAAGADDAAPATAVADQDADAAADDQPDELSVPQDDPVTGTADLFGDLEDIAQGRPASKPRRSRRGRAAAAPAVADAATDEAEAPTTDEADAPTTADAEAPVKEETASEAQTAPAPEPAQSPAVPARQSGSRKGRPAVPSWDDIMFGSRSGREE